MLIYNDGHYSYFAKPLQWHEDLIGKNYMVKTLDGYYLSPALYRIITLDYWTANKKANELIGSLKVRENF